MEPWRKGINQDWWVEGGYHKADKSTKFAKFCSLVSEFAKEYEEAKKIEDNRNKYWKELDNHYARLNDAERCYEAAKREITKLSRSAKTRTEKLALNEKEATLSELKKNAKKRSAELKKFSEPWHFPPDCVDYGVELTGEKYEALMKDYKLPEKFQKELFEAAFQLTENRKCSQFCRELQVFMESSSTPLEQFHAYINSLN